MLQSATVSSHAQTSSHYYFAIENLDTGEIVRRSETTTNGIPRGGIILAPDTNYCDWLFESDTGLIGFTDFRTPSPGRRFTIPSISLSLPLTPDCYRDGLSDDLERAIGNSVS